MKLDKTLLHTAGIAAALLCIMLLFISAYSTAEVHAFSTSEVHALMILVGDDSNIRASVHQNQAHMESLLAPLSHHCTVHLTLMRYGLTDKGPDVGDVIKKTYSYGSPVLGDTTHQAFITEKQVDAWLTELAAKAKPEDTVLIYFNGPGEIRGGFHHLILHDGQAEVLIRSELRQKLRLNPCRLKLLITDADSNEEHRENPDRLSAYSIELEGAQIELEGAQYVKHLFLEHEGLLDITATKPGHFAWSDSQIGGYFTDALVKSCTLEADKDGNGFLTWQEVFDAAKQKTDENFQAATIVGEEKRKLDDIRQTTQIPFAHSIPSRLDPADIRVREESGQQPRTRKPVDLDKMVFIPAGTFRMGTDILASKMAEPIHKVSLDAFYIDKYEVTLGEYKQFLMATSHRPLPPWVPKYATSDKHPVVGVSWRDAMAYATWAGKRLPTEAEWEKAARGGLMDMHYPWGNEEPDSSRTNFGKKTDQLAGVGKYPTNTFGLYDMAGNVSEWCLDPWDADFYANSPQENPFAGRKGRDETIRHPETVKGLRVVRGGSSMDTTAGAVHVAARHYVDAAARTTNIGFRCARDAPPTVTSQETQAPTPTSEGMVLIPAGPFRMGTDKLKREMEKPVHVVSLDAFYIDKYEVTLGEYEQFLMATSHRPLPPWVPKYATSDKHPVVGVSWRDAMAYATWAGKRLPTEAEWEKAARGGLFAKNYPWGDDEPDSARANYGKTEGTITPVGDCLPNAFGLYDMAGNVAEWCLDVWEKDYYSVSPEKNPFAGLKSRDETIRQFETGKGKRVVRGGSFMSSAVAVRVYTRNYNDATHRTLNTGFRCARDAPP